MVDSIVIGSGFSSITSSVASSSVPGGPYFYLEVNQTSVSVTSPDSIIIPLKVEWESGFYANPVTIELNNVTSGISSSIISVQNATHYKLFNIILDVSLGTQVGEHLFEIFVTETSTSDTQIEVIQLNIN